MDSPSVNLPQFWYFSSNCDHGRVAYKWLGGEVGISSEHPMSFPARSFYEEMSRVNQRDLGHLQVGIVDLVRTEAVVLVDQAL